MTAVFKTRIGFDKIMLRDQSCHQRVHNAFWHLIAILIDNGWVSHQMTDISDQHEAEPGKHQLTAIARRINPIIAHATGHAPPAFLHLNS